MRMKSLPSTLSIAARVMRRASGASTNNAMVSAGSTSCPAAARQPSQSPTSRKSISRKPVMSGGLAANTSMRPVGSGATPSR